MTTTRSHHRDLLTAWVVAIGVKEPERTAIASGRRSTMLIEMSANSLAPGSPTAPGTRFPGLRFELARLLRQQLPHQRKPRQRKSSLVDTPHTISLE